MTVEGTAAWVLLAIVAVVVLGILAYATRSQRHRQLEMRTEWLRFSNAHQLAFNPGNHATGPSASGDYLGYPLRISTEIVGIDDAYQRTRFELDYRSDAPAFVITRRSESAARSVMKSLAPNHDQSTPGQIHAGEIEFEKRASITTDAQLALDRYLDAERRRALASILSLESLSDVTITNQSISVSSLGNVGQAEHLNEIAEGLVWYAAVLS